MGPAGDQSNEDHSAYLRKECQSFRGRGINGGSSLGRAGLGNTLCRPQGVARRRKIEPCRSREQLGGTPNTWGPQLAKGVDVSGGGVAHRVPSLAPGQRSPSPDLLDGRHHLLDVILGPAPGLGPHGPAGHAGGAGAERGWAASRPAGSGSAPGQGAALSACRLSGSWPRPPSLPKASASPRPASCRRAPPRPVPGAAGRRGRPEPRPGSRPTPPRPGPPPRGTGTSSAPCPPPRGRLGAAGRLDARGGAAAVRSDHVGARGRERVCVPCATAARGGVPGTGVCVCVRVCMCVGVCPPRQAIWFYTVQLPIHSTVY